MSHQQQTRFNLITALFWLAQYAYIPQQSVYLTGIGVSAFWVGLIVGAYGLTQMLLRVPVGVYADLIGRNKLIILTGCASTGLASCIRLLLMNGAGFMAGNLLSGLASAAWISFVVFYTGQNAGNEQSATGRMVLFQNIGIMAGFLSSLALYSLCGMRLMCLISAVSGTAALILALGLEETPQTAEGLTVRSLLSACLGKRVLFFSFLALIQQGIQMATTMSFTNQILREKGASLALVGLSSVVYMISAVGFSAVVSSKLNRRFGPERAVPPIFALVAVYCVLVPRLDSIPGILLLQIIPGSAAGMLYSYLMSEALSETDKRKKTTVMGFFQAVYAIGMTVFPVAAGGLVQGTDYRPAYDMLALTAVVGVLAGAFYYRKKAAK